MWALGETPDYHIAVVEDITARKKAEDGLRKLNEALEQRIAERTKELESKAEELGRSQQALMTVLEDLNLRKKELEINNAKLNQLNRLFVGRELRMVELKERIEALEKELAGKEGI